VARPSRNTTGSRTRATAVVRRPKPVASASRASATIEADSTVRKSVVRLIASFQISDRVPSRLQCSVARMVAPSGPNGRSLAALEAPIAVSSLVPGACLGVLALPVLSLASIAGLLGCYGSRLLPALEWPGSGQT
jgi:hypothetical protein